MLREGMRKISTRLLSILRLKQTNQVSQNNETSNHLNAIIPVLFSKLDDGIFVLDRYGLILEVNPAFCRLSGYSRHELQMMPYKEIRNLLHLEWEHVTNELSQDSSWQGEIWLQNKNNGWHPFQLRIYLTANKWVGVLTETAVKEHDNDHLDPLTGLIHRLVFDSHLHQLCRGLNPFTLLTLDLDNFRQVNNKYDHQTGDRILKKIATRLQRIVGPQGVIARVGGDDFALLLPGINTPEKAQDLAEQIHQMVLKPFEFKEYTIEITGTLGGALWPLDARSPSALWRRAEQALFIARNRHLPMLAFSPDVRKELSYRQRLQQDLTEAIHNNQITVVYQPIWDNFNQRIVKLEALARWNHPELGVIPPDVFIPLAEECELISALGQRVLEKAAKELNKIHSIGFPWMEMSVNRSTLEFYQPDVVQKWLRTLAKYSVAPSSFVFEVTESLLMHDDALYHTSLNQLKAAGCKVAIDDFGTGYSSFNYLRKFPVDILKIDRSFVTNVPADQKETRLLEGILNIARNLEYKVVVEGVEDKILQQYLEQKGCEFSQGYLFSKPVNANEIVELLWQLSPANQKNAV